MARPYLKAKLKSNAEAGTNWYSLLNAISCLFSILNMETKPVSEGFLDGTRGVGCVPHCLLFVRPLLNLETCAFSTENLPHNND